MRNHLEINGRLVGPGEPTYVIAEMSANHNHDFERSAELVRAAKTAGADAVKVQTYTPDTMTIPSDQEYFRIGGGTLWDGRTLYDLYAEGSMPWEWQPKLKALAEQIGLDFFSTAYDSTAVDFLEELGVPVHKVASFEANDLELIAAMARTGKPLIISTGMATLGEIEEAVEAARAGGAEQVALLKCTSAYPAPPEGMNLRTIPYLAEAFGVPVGFSDHTMGPTAAVAAVALGASIVEKHFTLSRDVPGPDSAFSMEPEELRLMVEAIRTAERALGSVAYGRTHEEEKSIVFRRSLFVVEDMQAGEEFTVRAVRSIRPGHGLHPRHLEDVLGGRAARDIARGTPLSWDLIVGSSAVTSIVQPDD
jgi:pseudaminic acid synthase